MVGWHHRLNGQEFEQGSWWWTGRPGTLQSMGSQRVSQGWATGLNWYICTTSSLFIHLSMEVYFHVLAIVNRAVMNIGIHVSLWIIVLSRYMPGSGPGESHVCVYGCLVAQLCLTLCDPMDCSPPGSSVHGILQARILEWVAMPSSRGSSWPRDGTQVSHIAGGFFTYWATRDAQIIWQRSFQFLRNVHEVFHGGCTSLCSHQQCWSVPFSPACVMCTLCNAGHSDHCVKWNLTVVLICVSLIIRCKF